MEAYLQSSKSKNLKKQNIPLAMGFSGGSDSKESACKAGDPGSIPGSGIFPGERNGTLSSILAWEILWTEEPGGPQSMWSKRVGYN